jgi:hypothetical protein
VRPSVTTFSTPVTFVYRYEPGDIAPFMAADVELAVASGSLWTPLPTTVDMAMGTATAQATHLSTYGLIGASGAGKSDASVDAPAAAGGAVGEGGIGGAPPTASQP